MKSYSCIIFSKVIIIISADRIGLCTGVLEHTHQWVANEIFYISLTEKLFSLRYFVAPLKFQYYVINEQIICRQFMGVSECVDVGKISIIENGDYISESALFKGSVIL